MKMNEIRVLAVLAAAVLGGPLAHADSGTWTQISAGNASGTWSDALPGNWSGGIVADGSGFTADFSTLNITASSTITLGAPRTIGNLIFGDSDTSTPAVNWTLAGIGANVLTLAGGTPTITTNALGTNSLTTISAVIAGTNGLTKDGTGLLVLSGANTYSGGTTVSVGVLRAQNSSALGTGAVTVVSGAQLQLNTGVTIGNNININGATASNGLQSTTGNNTVSGTVTLQSNSIIAAANSSNTSLTVGNVNIGSFTLTASASGGSTGLIFINGTITGAGASGITKTGSSSLTITNDQTSTYSGTTTLTAGTLILGNSGSLGTGTFASVVGNDGSGGIRSLNANPLTIANAMTISGGNVNSVRVFGSSGTGNLTFTNTTSIALGTIARRFEVNNTTQFDAGFTGSGGIIKQTGTGTLILNGVNTYTGATTINAGTLLVNGSLSASSAVAVNSGGTLGGTNGTVGAVTVASGGSLAPGSSIGTFNTSSVALQSGSILKLELDTGTSTSDLLNVSGAFNLALTNDSVLQLSLLGTDVVTGSVFTLVDYGTWNGGLFTYLGGVLADDAFLTLGLNQFQISYNGTDGLTSAVTLTAVPEPTTYALLAVGGLALYVLRRKKQDRV